MNLVAKNQFIKEQVPALIASLPAETSPEWGIMTAQHMVEHLSLTFILSTGRFEVPCITPPEKLDRAKAFLMSDKPLVRNVKVVGVLPVDKQVPLKYSNIGESKDTLYKSIHKFYGYFEGDTVHTLRLMHPVFGKLNFEEWVHFHVKHCTHHLTQFGLLSE